MGKRKIKEGFVFKNIIFFTVFCFIFSNFTLLPQLLAKPAVDSQTEQATPQKLKETKPKKVPTAKEINLPADLGKITKSYSASPNAPLIIHIQDLHTNYEAQKKLSQTLEHLAKNYGVSLILVEGGSRSDSLSFLRTYAPKDVRIKVADKYLREGKICGENYLDIVSDDLPLDVFGIEKPELYDSNMEAFLAIEKFNQRALNEITSIKLQADFLKEKIYSKALKEFDQKRRDFKDEKLDAVAYINYLNSKFPSSTNPALAQNLSIFNQLAQLEKQIDFSQVENEHQAVIEKLSAKLTKKDLENLTKKAISVKEGKILAKDYYLYLKQVASPNGIVLEPRQESGVKSIAQRISQAINPAAKTQPYQNLINYIAYLILVSSLDQDELFKEIKQLEVFIQEDLAKNEQQKELVRISYHLELLANLLQLKITPDDYDYFMAHKDEMKTASYIPFLKKNGAEVSVAKTLDTNLERLTSFYAAARQRDQAFVDNSIKAIENRIEADQPKIAVLIAGGFHTEHITRMFKDKGMSYVVVSPKVTSVMDENFYHRVLRETYVPMSKDTETEELRQRNAGETAIGGNIGKNLGKPTFNSLTNSDIRDMLKKEDGGIVKLRFGEDGEVKCFIPKFIENYWGSKDDLTNEVGKKLEKLPLEPYQLERLKQYLIGAIANVRKIHSRAKAMDINGITIGILRNQSMVGWFADDCFSIAHAGEETATIYIGELLLRDILEKENDPDAKYIFQHEVEHIISPGYAAVEHKTDEYKTKVNEIRERCGRLEEKAGIVSAREPVPEKSLSSKLLSGEDIELTEVNFKAVISILDNECRSGWEGFHRGGWSGTIELAPDLNLKGVQKVTSLKELYKYAGNATVRLSADLTTLYVRGNPLKMGGEAAKPPATISTLPNNTISPSVNNLAKQITTAPDFASALILYRGIDPLANLTPAEKSLLTAAISARGDVQPILQMQEENLAFYKREQGVTNLKLNVTSPETLFLSGVPAPRTVNSENYPAFRARGATAVSDLNRVIAESLVTNRIAFSTGLANINHLMVHGYVLIPGHLVPLIEQKITDGRLHDTYFGAGNSQFEGSKQQRQTKGHSQVTEEGKPAFDLKYVTEGEGVQVIVYKGKDGKLYVLTNYLRQGSWAVALPGTIDYIVNLGKLRFNDISFAVREDRAQQIKNALGIADNFDKAAMEELMSYGCPLVFSKEGNGEIKEIIDADGKFAKIGLEGIEVSHLPVFTPQINGKEITGTLFNLYNSNPALLAKLMSEANFATQTAKQARARAELNFGTSGLRGLVTDMTDLECYVSVRGYIRYLKSLPKEDGGIKEGDTVSIAGDRRSSTDRIMAAVAKAIEDEGCKVNNCGKIPSPALPYYAMHRSQASLMVTGSHIPDDRNGIKPNKSTGEVLKYEEAAIKAYIKQVRQEEYAKLGQVDSIFNIDNDTFKTKPSLPKVNETAKTDYIRRYLDVFPADSFKGKKIVVYQHSAVGRDILVEVLEELGAEVIVVERSDDKFISVDTEDLKPELENKVKKWIKQYKPFAVVFMDGDSDRPGLFDEKGNYIWGDVLGILVSKYLDADFAAVTVSSNDCIDEALKGQCEVNRKIKIGSPYVIKAMIDAAKKGLKRVVGWEGNGGFLTQTDFTLNGKILEALPTRDAILPLISAMHLAVKENKNISQVMDGLPKRFKYTLTIKEFPLEISKKIIGNISPKYEESVKEEDKVQEVVFSGKEVKVTNTNGQPNQTDSIIKRLVAIKEKLERENFTSKLGFAPITSINFIDGVRITFSNRAIVHFRPSGNAPEFRIYCNADTEERAKSLAIITASEVLPGLRADIPLLLTSPIISNPAKDKSSAVLKKYDWMGKGIAYLLGWSPEDIAEIWFNSTQRDGLSKVPGKGITLENLIEDDPGKMLGSGIKTKPIFSKFLGKDENQPSIGHLGFNKNIVGHKDDFIKLVIQERHLVVELKKKLVTFNLTKEQFDEYDKTYKTWVADQIKSQWVYNSDIPKLPDFMAKFDVEIFKKINSVRYQIIQYLNEIDPKAGQVILAPVGYIHSVVGSHQTHPSAQTGHAKNEAWYVFSIDGNRLLYFEPQQTENITYSLFDFPTCIDWDDETDQPKMRKNLADTTKGLDVLLTSQEKAKLENGMLSSEDEAIRIMAERALKKNQSGEFEPVDPNKFIINNKIKDVTESILYSNPKNIKVNSLIEGTYDVVWPKELFILHRISLNGREKELASVTLNPLQKTFHELVVIKGEVKINIGGKVETLTAGSSVFIPYSFRDAYEITSSGEAEVLRLYPPQTKSSEPNLLSLPANLGKAETANSSDYLEVVLGGKKISVPRLDTILNQVKGKTVLVRVDYNVKFGADGVIKDDKRIRASLDTIKALQKAKAKIVLMSHLQPDEKQIRPEDTLAPVAKHLSELLNQEVTFVNSWEWDKISQQVKTLKEGNILLLENLRLNQGEKKNDATFAKHLVDVLHPDVFVQEAFGTVHRQHASMDAMPRLINPKAVGYLVEKEILYLGDKILNAEHPLVIMQGGVKVKGEGKDVGKIDILENLVNNVMKEGDALLLGGAMSYTFLKAKHGQEISLGKSLIELDMVSEAQKILKLAEERGIKVILPVDHICADTLEKPKKVAQTFSSRIPENMMGVDIGPKTVELFTQYLREAKTVLWNGPVGAFDKNPYFESGTKSIAGVISQVTSEQVTTIAVGGDTGAAVKKFEAEPTYVSTGGGAALSFLAGQAPGIEVLGEPDVTKVTVSKPDDAARGGAEGVISQAKHDEIRAYLERVKAYSGSNRREDLEGQLKQEGYYEGDTIRIYSVPGMLNDVGVRGHWAIRQGIIYVDKDTLDKEDGILYLKHEIDELTAIRKYADDQGWTLARLVKWLDEDGDPYQVASELLRIHEGATPLPSTGAGEIIKDTYLPDLFYVLRAFIDANLSNNKSVGPDSSYEDFVKEVKICLHSPGFLNRDNSEELTQLEDEHTLPQFYSLYRYLWQQKYKALLLDENSASDRISVLSGISNDLSSGEVKLGPYRLVRGSAEPEPFKMPLELKQKIMDRLNQWKGALPSLRANRVRDIILKEPDTKPYTLLTTTLDKIIKGNTVDLDKLQITGDFKEILEAIQRSTQFIYVDSDALSVVPATLEDVIANRDRPLLTLAKKISGLIIQDNIRDDDIRTALQIAIGRESSSWLLAEIFRPFILLPRDDAKRENVIRALAILGDLRGGNFKDELIRIAKDTHIMDSSHRAIFNDMLSEANIAYLLAELKSEAQYASDVREVLEGMKERKEPIILKISTKALGWSVEKGNVIKVVEEGKVKELVQAIQAMKDGGLKLSDVAFVDISSDEQITTNSNEVYLISKGDIDNLNFYNVGPARVVAIESLTAANQILVLHKAILACLALRNINKNEVKSENSKARAVVNLLKSLNPNSKAKVDISTLRELVSDVKKLEDLKQILSEIVGSLPTPVPTATEVIDTTFEQIKELARNI